LHEKVFDDSWLPGAEPFAVSDDRALLRATQGYLALDLARAEVAWRWDGALGNTGSRAEHVEGQNLFVAAEGTVTALDSATGRRLWHAETVWADSGAPVGLAKCGAMLVTYPRRGPDATLCFFNAEDGAPVGEVTLEGEGGFLHVAPVTGGLVAEYGDQLLAVRPGIRPGETPKPSGGKEENGP